MQKFELILDETVSSSAASRPPHYSLPPSLSATAGRPARLRRASAFLFFVRTIFLFAMQKEIIKKILDYI